jgi:hypothetical protein
MLFASLFSMPLSPPLPQAPVVGHSVRREGQPLLLRKVLLMRDMRWMMRELV